MEPRPVEHWFRRFLLAVAAAIFVGSIAELILVDHTEKTQQWLPFIFAGIGLISTGAARFRPQRGSLLALRWIMAAIAIGSIYGVYLHFSGNLAFTREINPSFSMAQSIWPAIKGSNPLLAPGVFFLAGVLGMAATYRHPKLNEPST